MKEKRCLLCCEDASLGYDNKALISHFSMRICAGDYVCVVGENGSGKSTLLKTVLGLLKPVDGRVEKDAVIEKGAIGYLPQQTQLQRQFPASVMEVVLSGFLNRARRKPFFGRAEKETAAQYLKKLGMGEYRHACYRNLSGGQQQRVLLARALCAAKDLLVLDEPMTGLDPLAAAELYAILRDLNREGMALMMVTHDIQGAVSEAQYILHMDDGAYFYGTVDAYLQSEFSTAFSERRKN